MYRRGAWLSARGARVRCRMLPMPSTVAWRHAPFDMGATRSLWFLPTTTHKKNSSLLSAPPPPLPNPTIVHVRDDCALEYIDIPPKNISLTPTTFVLLHGAPGTYRDFRHMIPHLQQQLPSVRIVSINFPGFGGSTVDKKRYFELLKVQRAAQLTLEALQQLIPTNERVILLGHSFGGHAVLNLAALNALSPTTSPLTVRGIVLLASAGARPHRVVRAREAELVSRILEASPPNVQRALSLVIKTFYTAFLGFPADFPPSHYVAGVLRAGTTDFSVIHDHIVLLHDTKIPSFSAWSSDDEFMEDDIPIALAVALGSSRRLAFRGAGHNLQKTRADVLAHEIASWMELLEDETFVGRETDQEVSVVSHQ